MDSNNIFYAKILKYRKKNWYFSMFFFTQKLLIINYNKYLPIYLSVLFFLKVNI
jgi:hypothetical protein